MNVTRSRLVALGLVRPDIVGNRKASQAHAIASRRSEMQRTVPVTHKVTRKGLSTILRAN